MMNIENVLAVMVNGPDKEGFLIQDGDSIEIDFEKGLISRCQKEVVASSKQCQAILFNSNMDYLKSEISDVKLANIVVISTVITLLSTIVTLLGMFCSFPQKKKCKTMRKRKNKQKTIRYRDINDGREWEEVTTFHEDEEYIEYTGENCE